MKVYILEDEANILQYIISLVDEIPFLNLVGYSGEINKAYEEIQLIQPDLILSDIQLKDGNSFEIFNKINTDAHVIFITAYNQYAIEALNIGALAYLLKPIDKSAFHAAIEKCYKQIENARFVSQQTALALQYFVNRSQPKRIALRNVSFTQIVDIDEIIYCQGDKGYTTFHLVDGTHIMVSKLLKEYECILPSEVFYRCHQSYLINFGYLKKYFKDGRIEMSNGDILTVSERRRNELQLKIAQI